MIQPFCVVECDDCGGTLISDPKLLNAVYNFGEFSVICVCFHCERPVTCAVEKEDLIEFIKHGVSLFSWEHGILDGTEAIGFINEHF